MSFLLRLSLLTFFCCALLSATSKTSAQEPVEVRSTKEVPYSKKFHFIVGGGMIAGGLGMPARYILGLILQSGCDDAGAICTSDEAPLLMSIGAGLMSAAAGAWLMFSPAKRTPLAKVGQASLGAAGGLLGIRGWRCSLQANARPEMLAAHASKTTKQMQISRAGQSSDWEPFRS